MLRIEDLHYDDEEAAFNLGRQAFGGPDRFDPNRPRMEAGRRIGAYLDGRLAGQVVRHGFDQCFGGRRIRCAGISGVMVAPEARGRGAARRMLTESLDRAVADGEVIAALYPTTAALYRSVGFEVAGWWMQRRVPLGELPKDGGPLTWERAEPDDRRRIDVYERMAADHDGWVLPGEGFWTWRAMQSANDESAHRYHYVGLREGDPVAVVRYSYGKSDTAMYSIDAEAVYAVDGDALRAALAFLGGNGTTADVVLTVTPVDDLALHLPHVQRTKVAQDWPWMLALLDLPGAITGRGFPEGVRGSVPMRVVDDHRPANDGNWVLSIADGAGTAEAGGDGRVTLTVEDLAAIFSGHLDPLRLATAGRLGHPTEADLGVLRAGFAGHPSQVLFF